MQTHLMVLRSLVDCLLEKKHRPCSPLLVYLYGGVAKELLNNFDTKLTSTGLALK